MKNLTQYIYSCTNAMFIYLHKGKDLDLLIKELKRIETHALEDTTKDVEGMELWFKFFHDDTGATDIKEIEHDLSLPENHGNRKYMLDNMDICTKDLNWKNELQVFLS